MTLAKIVESGESPFSVDITVSQHSLKGDEPEDKGGKNLGPAPYDLLTAALGECTAMTIRWFARQQNWPLEKVSVTLSHEKVEKRDVFVKSISLEGENLTPEQRQKLIEIAAKCPVQRTLEGTPLIETQEK